MLNAIANTLPKVAIVSPFVFVQLLLWQGRRRLLGLGNTIGATLFFAFLVMLRSAEISHRSNITQTVTGAAPLHVVTYLGKTNSKVRHRLIC